MVWASGTGGGVGVVVSEFFDKESIFLRGAYFSIN